jgi:hypothetical protein
VTPFTIAWDNFGIRTGVWILRRDLDVPKSDGIPNPDSAMKEISQNLKIRGFPLKLLEGLRTLGYTDPIFNTHNRCRFSTLGGVKAGRTMRSAMTILEQIL